MRWFKEEEFTCKCGCGKNNVDYRLMLRLDHARDVAGVPFPINSGCRCLNHNRAIGSKDTSSHIKGLAVDIRFETWIQMCSIIHGLTEAGFNRIGYNEECQFIHTDIDMTKPHPYAWRYNN